jgi:hypothetical protein
VKQKEQPLNRSFQFSPRSAKDVEIATSFCQQTTYAHAETIKFQKTELEKPQCLMLTLY